MASSLMALPTVPQSPAFARTTFGADGAGTTSTGGGRGALSYADALNAIIMSRLARPQSGPAIPAPRGGAGAPKLGGGAGARAGVKEAYDPSAALKAQAQRQAIIAQMAELADKNAQVPLHYTRRGFNAPALTADLAGMSMAQREAYEALGTKGTYGRNDEVEA